MSEEITNKDLLGTIQAFAESVDARFEGIDARFEGIDDRFESIDARFDRVESEIRVIKSTMATKDYVDRKFWELKSDMSAMMKLHVEQMH